MKLFFHALHENELAFINGGQHVEWAPEISTWTSLAIILASMVVVPTCQGWVRPAPHSKSFLKTWIVGGLVIFFALMFSIVDGFPAFLVILGMVGFVTAAYVAITGRRSWASIPTRKSAAIALAVSLVVLISGGVAVAATDAGETSLAELATSSNAWLDWCSLLAVGAVSEVDGEDSLEFSEDAVETQAAPTAFGRVSRSPVMKRWAALTRVMWWCHPA